MAATAGQRIGSLQTIGLLAILGYLIADSETNNDEQGSFCSRDVGPWRTDQERRRTFSEDIRGHASR
jgi:hypothetical protein